MIIDFITFSLRGAGIASSLKRGIEKEGNIVRIFTYYKLHFQNTLPFSDISLQIKESFKNSDGIVFVSSCDIAVKAIAPFIRNFEKNISVVSLDENTKFAISLISGISDKDENLASLIAKCSGAMEVITTQNEGGASLTISEFAAQNHLYCDNKRLMHEIESDYLSGQTIGFSTPFSHSALPEGLSDGIVYPIPQKGICVDVTKKDVPYEKTLFLYPKLVTLGIIFKKGTPEHKLENFIFFVLSENRIPLRAVENISTTYSRRKEEGIKEFCINYHIGLSFIPPDQVAAMQSSVIVENVNLPKFEIAEDLCEKLSLVKNNGYLLAKTYSNGEIACAVSVKGTFIIF